MKLKVSRELMYVLAMVFMPFAVALCTKADLGLSMIAAPTYIISERVDFLTYGQTEYIFQALVLVIMCIIIKKFKWSYLTSFVSAVIYGTVLDFYIWLLGDWHVTEMWMRVVVFILGIVFTALGVAMFINTYIAPCAYDYLVKMVVEERHFPLKKVKLINDFTYLGVSVALTLILFGKFVGVTYGTLIIAVVNGHLISWTSNFIQNHFELYDRFPKLAKIF